VEVVGHADREAYDLDAHSKCSQKDLTAYEQYAAPKIEDVAKVTLDKGLIGRTFRQSAQPIILYFERLSPDAARVVAESLEKHGKVAVKVEGQSFDVSSKMAQVSVEKEERQGTRFIPGVIEPSFGIGRIMYAIFEHCYTMRDPNDPQRSYLALPAIIAPTKVAILPISTQTSFTPYEEKLVKGFLALNLSTKVDDSGVALGRKYARADEVGTPYAITIDFDTLKDNSVTIRERDSMHQVRLPLDDAISVTARLCTTALTWEQVYGQYPRVHRDTSDDGDATDGQ